MATMDHEFDHALIQAAMQRAAAMGWSHVSIPLAAQEAGLPLDEARVRFPMRTTLLVRLGLLADQAALVDDGSTGTVRERLFDLLMRRIDVFQQHREGVRAVLRALPLDPVLALLMAAANGDSMRWMAEAAGVDTAGFSGRLRIQGVIGVWLAAIRAWDKDDSPDLSGTMAALDKALDRAEWLGRMLQRPLFDEVDPVAADADPASTAAVGMPDQPLRDVGFDEPDASDGALSEPDVPPPPPVVT